MSGKCFRNLTTKVWANLDSPIKSYDFQSFDCFLYAALSADTGKICDVTTVQLSNGTVHKFHTTALFMKIHPRFDIYAVTIKISMIEYHH